MAILMIYNSYDGMKSLSGVTKTAIYSIGNLGFSSALCVPVNYGVGNNVIACPYGSIQKVYSFGIQPRTETKLTPVDVDVMDFRVTTNRGVNCINKKADVCNKYLDLDFMRKTITGACLGKELCTINNFESFFKKDGDF